MTDCQGVWDRSGVPPRFRRIRFEKLVGVSDKVKRCALDYCVAFPAKFRSHKNGLYLYSATPGNGKTSVAVAILRHLIEQRQIERQACFISMGEVFGLIHEARRADVAFEVFGEAQRLFEAELLVIDDIGQGRVTDFVVDQYYQLINKLYSDCRPLIVTSNFSPSKMVELLNNSPCAQAHDLQLGERVVSRLREMTKLVHLGGEDHRIKA